MLFLSLLFWFPLFHALKKKGKIARLVPWAVWLLRESFRICPACRVFLDSSGFVPGAEPSEGWAGGTEPLRSHLLRPSAWGPIDPGASLRLGGHGSADGTEKGARWSGGGHLFFSPPRELLGMRKSKDCGLFETLMPTTLTTAHPGPKLKLVGWRCLGMVFTAWPLWPQARHGPSLSLSLLLCRMGLRVADITSKGLMKCNA